MNLIFKIVAIKLLSKKSSKINEILVSFSDAELFGSMMLLVPRGQIRGPRVIREPLPPLGEGQGGNSGAGLHGRHALRVREDLAD